MDISSNFARSLSEIIGDGLGICFGPESGTRFVCFHCSYSLIIKDNFITIYTVYYHYLCIFLSVFFFRIIRWNHAFKNQINVLQNQTKDKQVWINAFAKNNCFICFFKIIQVFLLILISYVSVFNSVKMVSNYNFIVALF